MRIRDWISDVSSSDLLRYRADAGVEVTEGKADDRRDCEAGDIVAHPAGEARSGVAAEITADRTAVAERQGEAVDRKVIGFAEEAERAYRGGERDRKSVV